MRTKALKLGYHTMDVVNTMAAPEWQPNSITASQAETINRLGFRVNPTPHILRQPHQCCGSQSAWAVGPVCHVIDEAASLKSHTHWCFRGGFRV